MKYKKEIKEGYIDYMNCIIKGNDSDINPYYTYDWIDFWCCSNLNDAEWNDYKRVFGDCDSIKDDLELKWSVVIDDIVEDKRLMVDWSLFNVMTFFNYMFEIWNNRLKVRKLRMIDLNNKIKNNN